MTLQTLSGYIALSQFKTKLLLIHYMNVIFFLHYVYTVPEAGDSVHCGVRECKRAEAEIDATSEPGQSQLEFVL